MTDAEQAAADEAWKHWLRKGHAMWKWGNPLFPHGMPSLCETCGERVPMRGKPTCTVCGDFGGGR